MDDHLGQFLNLDIPEEMHISRNIQAMAARAVVAGASPDDTAKAILGIVAGNVMEIEDRLIALEKQARIAKVKRRLIM
jgi:hypothetical protein